MSEAPQTPPEADGIEEGKRLIRLGGERGLSLAERVAERFQRLAWRTPLHSMRLRGRHPLKLISVADDPFLGDLGRGNALLAGVLSFRGEEQEVAGFDFERTPCSPAFRDYVQSFAWLRDLSTVATRARGAPIAEHLMRAWLGAYADTVSMPAWRGDLWGRRILFWTAHAPLILSSMDLVYRSSVLHALARGARHLDRVADRSPPGPPRIAAWCGVLVAGLSLPGGDPRRSFGEAGLQRALEQSVFEDGGVVTRSPMGQLDGVMLLSMLREAYDARRLETPEFLDATLTRMVSALLGVCHGDRGLGSWQGSGPLSGETIGQIVEASHVRTRPLKQARDWGYQRMAAGSTVLIVDAAPPPVARLEEGGCASTLAFELSDGPDRIIVNCGGARIAHAALPKALVEGLRTTAAHSTLVVGDSNSTAIHADGSLGRGVGEVELSRQESDTLSRVEASHDGYVRRFGFVHRRQLTLSPDGKDLRGEDSLLPGDRKRRKGETPFVVRFHLWPRIGVTPTADGMAAILRAPSGALWQFRCVGGTLSIEDSVWIDGQGRALPTQQLVLSGMAPSGGANVSWVFRRAR